MTVNLTGGRISGRRKRLRLIGGLLLAAIPLLPSTSRAGEVRAFSLQAAREFAVENSFEARRSQIDVQTARQKLKETVAVGLPQISSAVTYNNNLRLPTSLIPNFFEGKPEEKIPIQFGTQHNATANVQIQQLVFNGSYFVGLQTAGLYQQVADHGLERTRLQVRETVTGTYYLILVTAENERILKSTLDNITKTAGEIRELHREGFLSETDADLIQITVNQIENTLRTLEKQRDIAEKLLKFQMGLDLEEDITLTDSLQTIIRNVDIASALDSEFNPAESVDLKLVEGQARLAELALKNEKVKSLPTVSAFFTYQQNAFRSQFDFFNFDRNWFPFQILGINISLPVFRSGAQSARIQQAGLAAEQARNTALQAARGLELEDEQARTRLSSALDNRRTMEANLALAERVYDVTREKYREGLASSLELTQASDKHLQAQSSYIQALLDLLNAKNRLDRIRQAY
ncbi:MAG: TolC family protein [Acidobacteriota bacterium]|nr:TolC family protein [Acidobacteriota bacterium]